jgi:hypothetical protein
MGRRTLLTAVLPCALIATAALAALKSTDSPGGNKVQGAKEDSLSTLATAAPIDLRQPQHIETATFALG